ncbi:MAG: High-affinity zinc uptake system ATP-binding protein ZnuC [Chlamydiae bacterium]|nr:High-affinity zinc uptake system ATP-binding protein ZnuC [Chlamydiota bacterium]
MTISVENLSFAYEKHFLVLKNLSFSIAKGEFIGIFGPNGGGKTTLLKLLLGLLSPLEGKVQVLGRPPSEVTDRLGYVPQVRRFDKSFPISVLDVVLQGCLAKYRGYGNFSQDLKEKALEALERVGLQDKAKLAFGTLSGGQIQRILLARALASDPEILLLDEATVGIDPEALREIFQFLLNLRGKITIVLVTHELQIIAKEMNYLFCVNREISTFSPQQVCEHFAMGLYHPPLMKDKEHD